MDPLTAVILSGIVAYGVKKTHEKGVGLGADYQALKQGKELPSHAWRQALLDAQKDLIEKGAIDPTKLTATQYSRLLNSLGKQPGVGMLIAHQYRNAVAAANRKLNSYWDEAERRATDPEYARAQDERKAKAKADAQARRDEWKNNAQEFFIKIKVAGSSAGDGFGTFTEWMRRTRPTPDPGVSSGPDPAPGPDPSTTSTPGGKSTPGGGRTTPPPGPTGSARPGSRPGGAGAGGGGFTWGRKSTADPGPDPRAEADAARRDRAREYADWVENNRRPAGFTASPVDEPDTTPTPAPGALTRGPSALGAAPPRTPPPNPGPGPGPGPAPGGAPGPTPKGPVSGPGGGTKLAPDQPQPSNERKPTMGNNDLSPAPRRPSGSGALSRNAPLPSHTGHRERAAASARLRIHTKAGAIANGEDRLRFLVREMDSGLRSILDGAATLDTAAQLLEFKGAGPALVEGLYVSVNNTLRDAEQARAIIEYLYQADIHIGAAAAQFNQAPTDLNMYKD